MSKRIVFTVDRDGWTNGLQLGISQPDEGHGYRLAGPKYNGSSKTLLDYELEERDAAEIRKMLDAAFPLPVAETGGSRAEVLRAAADQQWAFAREHWIPTDDDSPSAIRKKDHKFGAAERLIGLIDPAAPALMPRHINTIPKGAGFLVRWQLGEETNSVWRASRPGADALAAELRAKGAGLDTAPRCENPKCGRPITRGAQWCSTWCHQASDTQAGKVIPKDETTQPAQPDRQNKAVS
ncbi:MAG: hypothetical protein JWO98_1281 [Frankiales bacterium]|nr:hypothetical protein [Frankiales bacterium]